MYVYLYMYRQFSLYITREPENTKPRGRSGERKREKRERVLSLRARVVRGSMGEHSTAQYLK